MKDIVLVVPSIRKESWDRFVEEWRRQGLFKHVDVILVEDNPTRTFEIDPRQSEDEGSFAHYCWEDIERELGSNSWIIPRRSDTVRSFGYYMAWRGRERSAGSDPIETGWRYVLTLDDDCYPPTEEKDGFHYKEGARSFLDIHRQPFLGRSRWFNTLTSVKPRGIPFGNLGFDDNIVLNHGLWTNVLDYDAPTQLVNPVPERFSFDSRIVPSGQFFPMCGMNLMWKIEITVLMYHLLMGKQKIGAHGSDGGPVIDLENLPFDRFGDIWAGIIAKKIIDIMGLAVSTGIPYIHHDRASNPFVNLKKEANGLEVNERFWEYVDRYPGAGRTFPFTDHYKEMGHHISKYDEFPQYSDYFWRLGQAMIIWADLFRR
jgi:reversibly glycosylated polypeptide/UDP-arabinopyranose mutase